MTDNKNNAGLALLAAIREERERGIIADYIPPFVPSLADQHYNGVIAGLNAEIESLRSRAEKAEAERDELQKLYEAQGLSAFKVAKEWQAKAEAAEATCEKLAAALEPFIIGDEALEQILFGEYKDDRPMNFRIPIGRVREARRALSAYRNVTTVNASGPKGETPDNCRDGGADANG